MFVNDYWKQFGQIELKWHYLNASIYAAIGILSFIANSMVLLYIFRIKKRTHRPNGIMFSVNLAIADIGKVMINLPMTSISSFYGEWIFDQIGCDIYGLAGGLFGFISITTLVFMSVERYLIVKSPLNIECFNVKIKMICITFTWIYSALMITIQLFSKNSFVLEGMLTSCSFDYLSRDSLSRCYMLLMLVGGFVIPLMLIIIFYVLTKKEIKKKNNYFFRMNSSERRRTLNSMSLFEDNSLNSTEMGPIVTKKDSLEGGFKMSEWKGKFLPAKKNTSSGRKTSSTQSSRNYYYYLLRREKRVLKRIILNVTCFCLAWMPYVIMTLTAQFGNNIENYINPFSTSVPGIIAKISSIYNPILYTLTNKNCKNYYKRLLRISKE